MIPPLPVPSLATNSKCRPLEAPQVPNPRRRSTNPQCSSLDTFSLVPLGPLSSPRGCFTPGLGQKPGTCELNVAGVRGIVQSQVQSFWRRREARATNMALECACLLSTDATASLPPIAAVATLLSHSVRRLDSVCTGWLAQIRGVLLRAN